MSIAAISKFLFTKNFNSRILEYSEISIFMKKYVRYDPNYGFVQNNFLYTTVVFTEPFTSYLVSSGVKQIPSKIRIVIRVLISYDA